MRIAYEKEDMKSTEKLIDEISDAILLTGLLFWLVSIILLCLELLALGILSVLFCIACFACGAGLSDYIQKTIKERREEEGYNDLVRLNDSKPTKTDGWK